MKSFMLLLFIINLSSCGFLLETPDHDHRFDPILEQFKRDAQKFGVDLSTERLAVAFGDPQERIKYGFVPVTTELDVEADGACFIITTKNNFFEPLGRVALGKKHGTRFVIIDRQLEDSDLEYLESLVYHELGHCILNQSHSDTAIMTEYGVDRMGEFRYFYLKELFTGQRPKVSTLYGQTRNDHDLELVYDVSYEAFGQKIEKALYYDAEGDRYVYRN